MFSGIKLWIAGIGSALLAGLVLFGRLMKKQRDAARKEGVDNLTNSNDY